MTLGSPTEICEKDRGAFVGTSRLKACYIQEVRLIRQRLRHMTGIGYHVKTRVSLVRCGIRAGSSCRVLAPRPTMGGCPLFPARDPVVGFENNC